MEPLTLLPFILLSGAKWGVWKYPTAHFKRNIHSHPRHQAWTKGRAWNRSQCGLTSVFLCPHVWWHSKPYLLHLRVVNVSLCTNNFLVLIWPCFFPWNEPTGILIPTCTSHAILLLSNILSFESFSVSFKNCFGGDFMALHYSTS